ncbi:MAG: SH3 domain-containing protein [Anaerolineae bacterium]|jgi:hypothetical protein|nr:SH3 domain-containing protein [Anaerolineae bacterium]
MKPGGRLTPRICAAWLCLLLAGCAMTAPTAPASPVPAITGSPTPTTRISRLTPAAVTPVAGTREPVCRNTPVSRLIVHERGQVTNNGERLNIRAAAGTRFAVVARLEPQEIFLVIGGPACADGYTWYQVRYENGAAGGPVEGWIAEGDRFEYYAVPYLPG